jgi:hypothetical protein
MLASDFELIFTAPFSLHRSIADFLIIDRSLSKYLSALGIVVAARPGIAEIVN